jgi:hypothetical protein
LTFSVKSNTLSRVLLKTGGFMPILSLEGMGGGLIGLPEEERKPVICVFDPMFVHAPILDLTLGGIREKVIILWQALFSTTWIDVGGVDEWTHGGLIAVERPVLLISELEVIPGGYLYGIKMLKNLRCTSGLENVPLIVISGADCLLKAHNEAGKKLAELKINQFFNWENLERKPKERERLFDFVSQIPGLKGV